MKQLFFDFENLNFEYYYIAGLHHRITIKQRRVDCIVYTELREALDRQKGIGSINNYIYENCRFLALDDQRDILRRNIAVFSGLAKLMLESEITSVKFRLKGEDYGVSIIDLAKAMTFNFTMLSYLELTEEKYPHGDMKPLNLLTICK